MKKNKAEISKLKISDGDVIIVRGAIMADDFKKLRDCLIEHGKKNVILLNLQEGQTMESVDRKKLAASGWVFVRTDHLSETIRSLWRDALSAPPGEDYNRGYNQALEDAAGVLLSH